MTLDGICDHTAITPDEEIHQHYTDLLFDAGAILYGRKTFELMKFWQSMLENPSGEKHMDDFAMAIDRVPKIVFSHTMKNPGWQTAMMTDLPLEQKVQELKLQQGRNIFAGSRSLIIQLININLIDELQICVHPLIAGKGLSLFENITARTVLKYLKSKTFSSGAVILYYAPENNQQSSFIN